MLECSFLIPTRRDAEISDGKLHGKKPWRWLRDSLLETVGDYTRAPGEYEGTFTPEPGKQMRDESRRFIVALDKRRLPQLRALLRRACVVFEQRCIYLSVAGHVELVYGPNN